jgi:hypothetical protein
MGTRGHGNKEMWGHGDAEMRGRGDMGRDAQTQMDGNGGWGQSIWLDRCYHLWSPRFPMSPHLRVPASPRPRVLRVPRVRLLIHYVR